MFDMFSASRKLAAQYREVFDALISMGFNEEQSMQILIQFMAVAAGAR